MKFVLALALLAGVAVTSTARLPAPGVATPQIKRDAQCMLRVLKSVSGIDTIESGMSDVGGWQHPFLQYRAAPLPNGYRAVIRFDATTEFHSDDRKSFFIANLSGMSAVNEEAPDYGAGAMATLWEKKCDVHVMVLFV